MLQRSIATIGSAFYVTRSFESEKVGNSEYWALLARPSTDFSVFLNADRELLFLFSTYENFEVRTLEAYDTFYNKLEQKRVDLSLRFLISADPRIEDIIRHYLNQNPEYPIIIPIFAPNIGSDPNHIVEAVRRNFVLRDLFGYQNPLREETFFFGRLATVSQVLDRAKSGQSSSIFGLRKSGKTSTIFAIQRRAKSFGCVPVFIDCQSPEVHASRYSDLLWTIADKARRAIGHQKPINRFRGTDAEISRQFREQMSTAASQSKSRLLIIFDEIENITPGTASSRHWNEDADALLLWQNLRTIVQQDSKASFAICLVGTNPQLLEIKEIQGVANPMYLFCPKTFLSSFTLDETRAMLNRLGFFMGLDFSDNQASYLHTTYGGHPFFIRQVCSTVHQKSSPNRPIHVSGKLIQDAEKEFQGTLDGYINNILESLKKLYPGEYRLLESIVSGNADEVAEYANLAPEYIDHLIGYELIERRSEDVEIRFPVIEKALRRAIERERKAETENIEKVWQEITLRRNRLETELRRELFSLARTLSAEEWNALLNRHMTEARLKKLDNTEPRNLCSPKQSPLYLSDLIALLESEHFCPDLGERRSTVLNLLKTINFKGRPDAHAKSISASDLNEVRSALTYLEDEFVLNE